LEKCIKRSFGSLCGAAIVGASLIVSPVQAETRVTYKSAKSTSSYYQMAVQALFSDDCCWFE
jgi:hypothetical protein